MKLSMPRLVIAAAQSGSGKTTLATGLMAALARRGLRVQPYKIGPDYIDPTYHSVATGRRSRNLDGWMFGEEAIRGLFVRTAADADIALIEGVMGLFDGAGPSGEAGSTAQVARWLAAPVLLVVDARGMARTAAAVVRGLAEFDPSLRVAGVVFNNVGSEHHYQLLAAAVNAYARGVDPVGYVPKDAAIRLPERHLGLVPSYEREQVAAYLDRLAEVVGQTVDLDAVLRLARTGSPPLPMPAGASAMGGRSLAAWAGESGQVGERVRIGLARDAAFNFYYEDGLDLLRDLGADLVEFSPLSDFDLPADLDALYLGGGFPEVYRQTLAANEALRAAVGAAIAAGLPTYAECGGLMFLTEAIVDESGTAWPMVGAIPVRARMTRRLASLGYATAVVQDEVLIAGPGETLRGHEFHWSVVDGRPAGWPPAYLATTRRGGTRPDGFFRQNLLASYVHLHFVANPRAAARLVAAAGRYRAQRLGPEKEGQS
ncbi:MAG: cobyrinate a,c-diamide synthase [Bacillota bacterium]